MLVSNDLVVKVCRLSTDIYLNHYVGVEKNNDCARKHFFSSNHQDAARDILLTDSRVEELQHGKRAKRKYEKKDTSYWELGVREKRRKLELEPQPDTCQ